MISKKLPYGVPEETPMKALFGKTSQIKIIQTLLAHPYCEYSLDELAECSDVSNSTVFKLKDLLLHYKIMKPTKSTGNTTLYTLDKESTTGKLLKEFMTKLAEIDIELLTKQWKEEQGKVD